MSDSKIIAVVGATCSQGGGLARAILDDGGDYRLRAITRNPDSDAARALADRGAEVVQADLDDVESLKQAFDGAYGAFFVTNFWEHFSPEKEQAQVANLAEAAKAADLQHVIWSTLEDTRRWVPLDDDRMPTLQEKYKVPHFDAKGGADHEFTDRGVPTTFLLTSFYWDNFIHFGLGPQRMEDGSLALVFPLGDAKMPGIAAEDIGRTAYGIFKAGDRYIGETVGISGEHISAQEMADAMTQTLGQDVGYTNVPPEVYRGFDFDGSDDLGNMFQFYRDFEDDFRRPRDVEATRGLNPQLQSFGDWLSNKASQIPIP